MQSINQYAAQLKKETLEGNFGWSLQLNSTNSKEENKVQIEATLKQLGEIRTLAEIAQELDPGGSSTLEEIPYSKKLDILSKEFLRDIVESHSESFPELVKKTSIIFLPNREIAAFCLGSTEANEKLDGNLICFNEGLYFCTQLIGKAMVYSNLGGDYEEFRQSGSDEFKTAIDFFVNPKTKLLNKVFFRDLPPDINGEMSAMQSTVAMKIMQFVLDHEFGHIANGDLTVQHFNRRYVTKKQDIIGSDEAKLISWAMEFEADKFALNSLNKTASSEVSACANFLTVSLFFLWLEQVEIQAHQQEFHTHPPAADRLTALVKIMEKRNSEWINYSDMLQQMKAMVLEWII